MNALPAIGVARELPALLRIGPRSPFDVDRAIADRLLYREKIEGVWIYSTAEAAISSAEAAAFEVVESTLGDWLLGPLHPLAGFVANAVPSLSMSKNVVRQFLRRWLREDRLTAIGMFTNAYEPYLAALLCRDTDEVHRQLDHVRPRLRQAHPIFARDLPEPIRARSLQAWRDSILRHCEYLGFGQYDSGVLRAWPKNTT